MGHKTMRGDPIGLFRRHMRRSFRHYLYGFLTILIVYLIFRWLSAPSSQKPFVDYDRMPADEVTAQLIRPEVQPREVQSRKVEEEVRPKENKVYLEVYIEAQCPDTTHFFIQQLWPTWQELSGTGRIHLTAVPFGKARCIPRGADFSCQCQHGPSECELNQLMNCVIERLPFPEKHMPVLHCIQGKDDLDHAEKACIVTPGYLPVDSIMACARGQHGRQLLALAGQKTESLQPQLNFVPWVVINGERSIDAMYALKENLCKKLSPPPPQCA